MGREGVRRVATAILARAPSLLLRHGNDEPYRVSQCGRAQRARRAEAQSARRRVQRRAVHPLHMHRRPRRLAHLFLTPLFFVLFFLGFGEEGKTGRGSQRPRDS